MQWEENKVPFKATVNLPRGEKMAPWLGKHLSRHFGCDGSFQGTIWNRNKMMNKVTSSNTFIAFEGLRKERGN